jgi:hypothetical protein
MKVRVSFRTNRPVDGSTVADREDVHTERELHQQQRGHFCRQRRLHVRVLLCLTVTRQFIQSLHLLLEVTGVLFPLS